MFSFLRFTPEQDAMGVGDLDSFLIEPVLDPGGGQPGSNCLTVCRHERLCIVGRGTKSR
jgi:hypothetical protein